MSAHYRFQCGELVIETPSMESALQLLTAYLRGLPPPDAQAAYEKGVQDERSRFMRGLHVVGLRVSKEDPELLRHSGIIWMAACEVGHEPFVDDDATKAGAP